MTDAYTFAPGYMVASDGSPALHAEWSAMAEAHLYCDAEPRIYHTGLEPQTNRTPLPKTAQVCYSHVRASPCIGCSGFSLAAPGFSIASKGSSGATMSAVPSPLRAWVYSG